ncbi:hypothetical protein [Bacteroides faecis]|jgi:hypothetical protein|uniref:hypothetical protein n=1 Tax=Bacteroides faecis TaxID=674529 RepID=UPI0034A13B7D
MNNNSLRSPKHKFSSQICFDKPLEGVGSTITLTSDDLNELKHLSVLAAQGCPSHVIIRENTAEYPSFEWSLVDEYNLNKHTWKK